MKNSFLQWLTNSVNVLLLIMEDKMNKLSGNKECKVKSFVWHNLKQLLFFILLLHIAAYIQ